MLKEELEIAKAVVESEEDSAFLRMNDPKPSIQQCVGRLNFAVTYKMRFLQLDGPVVSFHRLSARSLSLAWGNDPRYWEWVRRKGSWFEEVAYLNEVAWLSVDGTMSCNLWPGKYTLSWRLLMGPRSWAKGERVPARRAPVLFEFVTSDGQTGSCISKNLMLDTRRSRSTVEEWSELDVGTFFVFDSTKTSHITFSMRETKGLGWKRGLFLDGVVVQPSIYLEYGYDSEEEKPQNQGQLDRHRLMMLKSIPRIVRERWEGEESDKHTLKHTKNKVKKDKLQDSDNRTIKDKERKDDDTGKRVVKDKETKDEDTGKGVVKDKETKDEDIGKRVVKDKEKLPEHEDESEDVGINILDDNEVNPHFKQMSCKDDFHDYGLMHDVVKCLDITGEILTKIDVEPKPNVKRKDLKKDKDENEDVEDDDQVRPDISAKSFRNIVNKAFDGTRVLFLIDKDPPFGEVSYSFYHIEGMASVLGLGLANAIVTVKDSYALDIGGVDEEDEKASKARWMIRVDEVDEKTWNARWMKRNMHLYAPIIFEQSKVSHDVQETATKQTNIIVGNASLAVGNATNPTIAYNLGDLDTARKATCPLLLLTQEFLEGRYPRHNQKEPSSSQVHASNSDGSSQNKSGTSSSTCSKIEGQQSKTTAMNGDRGKALASQDDASLAGDDKGNVQVGEGSSKTKGETNIITMEIDVFLDEKFTLKDVSKTPNEVDINLESNLDPDVRQLKTWFMESKMSVTFLQRMDRSSIDARSIHVKFHVTYMMRGKSGAQGGLRTQDAENEQAGERRAAKESFGWYQNVMEIEFGCDNRTSCTMEDDDSILQNIMESGDLKNTTLDNWSEGYFKGNTYTAQAGVNKVVNVHGKYEKTDQATTSKGQAVGADQGSHISYLKNTMIALGKVVPSSDGRKFAYQASKSLDYLGTNFMWQAGAEETLLNMGLMGAHREIKVGGRWEMTLPGRQPYSLRLERHLYRHTRTEDISRKPQQGMLRNLLKASKKKSRPSVQYLPIQNQTFKQTLAKTFKINHDFDLTGSRLTYVRWQMEGGQNRRPDLIKEA